MTKTLSTFHMSMLVLLLSATYAWSNETRYYDIEVIIVESKDASDRQSEEWPNDIAREAPQTYIELGQPYPGPLPAGFDPKHTFKSLPRSAYRLQQEVKLLEASDRYHLLYHTAWRQPGMDPATALPVHITQTYTRQDSSQATQARIDPDRPPSSLPVPGYPQQSRAVLDGYIRIILSRYLHAEVDLMYATGLPVSSGYAASISAEVRENVVPPVIYRLQESRRMRSTEVHYLDHPVIGLIVLVTPYEGK